MTPEPMNFFDLFAEWENTIAEFIEWFSESCPDIIQKNIDFFRLIFSRCYDNEDYLEAEQSALLTYMATVTEGKKYLLKANHDYIRYHGHITNDFTLTSCE